MPYSIEIKRVKGLTDPQKKEKKRAIAIMRSFGYSYIDQEIDVRGGIADVLMSKDKTKAVVECCSVTVSKGIECLADDNVELWIFAKDGSIYKLTRGKKWNEMYRFYQKYDLYLRAKAFGCLLKRAD